jgi:hypothetical protein
MILSLVNVYIVYELYVEIILQQKSNNQNSKNYRDPPNSTRSHPDIKPVKNQVKAP